MQNSNFKLTIFLVFIILFVPSFTSAAITNIWEGTGGGTELTTCNIAPYHCTFCDGAIVTINIIEMLLVFGVIIAVIMALYGGIRLMTSGGSQTQISQGKDIIVKAVVGFIIVSCAWIIVSTVFKILTTKTDWNTLDLIGCQGGKLANNALGPQKPNKAEKDKEAKNHPGTEAQLNDLIYEEEGLEVAPITNCYTQGGTIQEPTADLLTQTASGASDGDRVVASAKKYLGKLFYTMKKSVPTNIQAIARRDPDGKTDECKNLIKGTNYTGCGDCSGFAFKIYACTLGENIGEERFENITVNSGILKTGTLPDGFERYFTENLSVDEIKQILKPGDILGYDQACKKQELGSASAGHVMIFSGFSGKNNWNIIDHGSSGGARLQEIGNNWKPFSNCGYIIHIKSS